MHNEVYDPSPTPAPSCIERTININPKNEFHSISAAIAHTIAAPKGTPFLTAFPGVSVGDALGFIVAVSLKL